MGMSASQARFLSLTARKTNVEYEGQQINQQRTALSNESSNYYSQLTSLTVPTPPSSSDFTKITYTFANGSETNMVTSLVATKSTTGQTGIYRLNYVQQIPQDSMIVEGTTIISRIEITPAVPATDTTPEVPAVYDYYVASTKLQEAYTGYTEKPVIDDTNRATYEAHFQAAGIPIEVLHNMSNEELANKVFLESQYESLSKSKYGDTTEWYVRYQQNSTTKNYEPVFYNKKELLDEDYNEKTTMSLSGLKAYVYGPSVETREVKNVYSRVEQDATGRYIGIVIYPTKDDADNNTNGTYYDLTTTNENDEAGYNDAMNQYYYDKSVYDQTIQEINAKIEIIEEQDKNLELKLKQLDTEQNAISTEMDAVKKVISKNVESSFKTFNA